MGKRKRRQTRHAVPLCSNWKRRPAAAPQAAQWSRSRSSRPVELMREPGHAPEVEPSFVHDVASVAGGLVVPVI